MKELFTSARDQTEIVYQKQLKKEVKLIGSQRRIPGLTLWEYNLKTKQLVKAEFKKIDHKLNFDRTDLEKRYQVIINENCTYFQALNEKNAIKVLKRDYNILYKPNQK